VGLHAGHIVPRTEQSLDLGEVRQRAAAAGDPLLCDALGLSAGITAVTGGLGLHDELLGQAVLARRPSHIGAATLNRPLNTLPASLPSHE
jgi:hypothetical protein